MTSIRSHAACSLKKCTIILLCLVIQLLPWQTCYGDERIEAIKLAYLYNFAKFTHWHDIAETAEIHIQIIGVHPFGDSLSPVASKNIEKHPIKISTLENYNPELPLHILFISRSHAKSLQQILSAVSNKQVLTISDIPNLPIMAE